MGDSRVGTVSECFKYFSREMPYWCTMTHYTLCFRICVDVEQVSDKTGLDSPPQSTPWTLPSVEDCSGNDLRRLFTLQSSSAEYRAETTAQCTPLQRLNVRHVLNSVRMSGPKPRQPFSLLMLDRCWLKLSKIDLVVH